MRYALRICPALLVAVSLATALSAAQSKPVPTMAGIVLKLNHFASDDEKKTLKAIVDDKAATASEKAVAQALINLQHKVSDADKPKLEAIVKDQAAPEGIKTLAAAILAVNHTATDADKEKLKKLAGA